MSKKQKSKKAKKVKKIRHKIDLRVAVKMDFLELDKYIQKDKKKVKSWKMMKGIPYWMFNSKGVIENKNYILSDDTDLEEFGSYLLREQILILTSQFD